VFCAHGPGSSAYSEEGDRRVFFVVVVVVPAAHLHIHQRIAPFLLLFLLGAVLIIGGGGLGLALWA
jgi:hypothetical protein